MKVLYVTDPGADYLSDQIYDGLCSVLERQNVIDFPAKPPIMTQLCTMSSP
jgi:hypothetical protein